MRKYLILVTVCIYNVVSYSQNVGIGISNPQNKLHVGGGFRLDTLTGVNGAGLLRHDANGVVYGIKLSGNTNEVLRGDGSFGEVNVNGAIGWLLNGNNGTTPATHFLGTIDNQPLLFRVNNIRHGYLGSSVFWGSNAGLSNTGSGNVGIGRGAIQNSQGIGFTGLVAVGDSALFNNIGNNPGTNAVGIQNTAVGARSLYSNSSGNSNTAVGSLALEFNTTGSDNSAFGIASLRFNRSGSNNTAIGRGTLAFNSNGHNNTAIGVSALANNSGGSNNTSVGGGSLITNSSGANNTAMGFESLWRNNTGSFNCAVGARALNNSTSTGNSAVGYEALVDNTTGSVNTAMGYLALENNTTGFGNTAMGGYALRTITSGSLNTAVGYQAGWGFNPNTFGLPLGLPPNVSNVTCIGFDAGFFTTSSNQVNIGNFSVGWIGGNVGWGTYSDKRMKQHIKEDIPGLAFITRLKPVSYHINLAKEKAIAKANIGDMDWDGKYDIEKRKMTGFLAQDVEAAANEINYNFSGIHKPKNGDGLYSLEYSAFVVPLVKAVQEQQKIIEDQNKKIDKQQQQIDLLIKEIQNLKKEYLTQKN